MDSEISDLKKVLRSLVVSSPSEVDVRTLLRDYRNMMGGPIPLAKYGYKDALTFLKERCGDCFLFQGPVDNPVLTLIVPKTLQHIDKFVQKQKSSHNVKFKGKRRSVPEAVVKPIEQTHIENNIVKSFKQHQRLNAECSTFNEAGTVDVHSKVESSKTSVPDIDRLQIEDKHHNPEQNGCSRSALKNFLKKRMPLYCSQELDTDKTISDKTSSKDSGRQTSSTGSRTSKAALFEELKQEIQDLLADYPDGVWCTDLIRLYREKHGREVNFARFGYTSIVSLVFALEPSVHAAAGDAGDWLLQDARRGPPPAAATRRRHRPRPAARAAYRPAAAPHPDDALPGIDFDPDVFPEDCMHYLESIPAVSLRGLEPGAMVELVVGEVYSPSHFWVLRLGERYNMALDNLMDEMTEYYTSGEGKDRHLAVGAAQVGQYCTSLYDRDWHRSIIVKIIDSETVKVRHVDYGTVESVRVSALKPLLRRWAALPAQAARARLAGVRPAGGRRWPHAAAAAFLQRVRDVPLVGNLVALDHQEDILELFLVDTRGDEDVCIGDELVRYGHADPRSDSVLAVSTGLSPPAAAPDLRSLVSAVSSLRASSPAPEPADDASEVSASASEVVGRAPRRLPTWDCGSSPAPSLRLARLRAQRQPSTPPPPPARGGCSATSLRLARLRALHTAPAAARPPSEPSSGSDAASSVLTVSSRLLQRRRVLAGKLNVHT